MRPLAVWRLRAVRAATAGASVLAIGWVGLSANVAYSLISAVAPTTKPLTAVTTPRKQVGLMVDATTSQVVSVAAALEQQGMHASLAIAGLSDRSADQAQAMREQVLPRLGDGGVVGWLGTRHRLHELLRGLGWGHHFLYASSGPSLGQWLFAHGAGGKLVAGAVRLTKASQVLPKVHAGEVIEIHVSSVAGIVSQIDQLASELRSENLQAVSIGMLLRDSGTPV